MPRVRSILFHTFAVLSLLLCLAVCGLKVRAYWVSDRLEWRYNRYLADKSAAATLVTIANDRARIRLYFHSGWIGPFNGNLVYGYYLNADQSKGAPKLDWKKTPWKPPPAPNTWAALFEVDPDADTVGWGPVRGQYFKRFAPPPGEDFKLVRFDVSHWLYALLFAILPILWLNRFRKARRARRVGHCPHCGYDLRATPDRCPECGEKN